MSFVNLFSNGIPIEVYRLMFCTFVKYCGCFSVLCTNTDCHGENDEKKWQQEMEANILEVEYKISL